ncbi:hypothetical protein ACOSQ2_002791 [Xanthoceras sorbifolium]
MASSNSRKHDPLIKNPEISCSDSSSTGDVVGKGSGVNVVSSSPLVSISGGRGVGSSMVRSVSDDRSFSMEIASVSIFPSVCVEDEAAIQSLLWVTF